MVTNAYGPVRVFLDANVLVPITVTDLFLRLAEVGLVEPLWSRPVLTEMLRALVQMHGHSDIAKWESRIQAMNDAFPFAEVAEVNNQIEARLPDPDDEHVLAGAVDGGAQILLTYNTRDFPELVLRPFGIKSMTPDEFLMCLMKDNAESIHLVVSTWVREMRHPPIRLRHLIEKIRLVGMPRFADALAASDGLKD